ncbi:MAG TPA: hypothetical protein VM221_12250 [Armatimonadota bacterium]|nr:hypothetical protein [Armatimonadota bacterium]
MFQELAQRIAYLEGRIAELEKRVDLLHLLVLKQRGAAPDLAPTIPQIEQPRRREDDKSRPKATI